MDRYQPLNIYRSNYFEPQTSEEECPLHIPDEYNEKYEKLEKLFNSFFNVDSYSLANDNSKNEREKLNNIDPSFIYGEVTFRSLAYIFEYIKNTNDITSGAFYDLGSGIGRGVLAAAFLFPFTKYVGIEYLETLYNTSLDVKKQYDENFLKIFEENKEIMTDISIENEEVEVRTNSSNINSEENNSKNSDSNIKTEKIYNIYNKDEKKEENNEENKANAKPPTIKLPEMLFFKDDFLKIPIRDASFVFANSTCFSMELMLALSKKCKAECKEGCFVITFTKKLPNLGPDWEIKNGFKRNMSWGIATVFVHHKKYSNK